mgnify:CR=1 FL=1
MFGAPAVEDVTNAHDEDEETDLYKVVLSLKTNTQHM